MTEWNISFGERVRHYRTLRGMTGEALAATVGRGHSMLSAIEHGRRKIHADEVVVFARALGVSPVALLGGDERDLYRDGYGAGYQAGVADCRRALAAVPPHPAQDNPQ